MISAKILHNLLNIIVYLILISITIGMIFSVLMFFSELPSDKVLTGSNLMTYKGDSGLYVFISLMLLVYVVFIFGIWKLKEACGFLMEHNFYNTELIKKIIIFGKCMIIAGVFSWLIDGLSSIHFNHEASISLTEKTFMYLFIIAIGLFAMLMGNILYDAKTLKEENDLTI